MLAELDPRVLGRLWFPLGGQTKDARRAPRPPRPGSPPPRRAESQEACFLAGDDYRALPRAPRARAARRGRWSTRRTRGRDARRVLALHRRASGAGSASPRRSRVYALSTDAEHEHRRRRLARVARAHARLRSRAARTPSATRVEAKLRYRSPAVPATVEPTAARLRARASTQPAYGVAPGQTAVLYADDAVVGSGVIVGSAV